MPRWWLTATSVGRPDLTAGNVLRQLQEPSERIEGLSPTSRRACTIELFFVGTHAQYDHIEAEII
jgi:hypothetical protein